MCGSDYGSPHRSYITTLLYISLLWVHMNERYRNNIKIVAWPWPTPPPNFLICISNTIKCENPTVEKMRQRNKVSHAPLCEYFCNSNTPRVMLMKENTLKTPTIFFSCARRSTFAAKGQRHHKSSCSGITEAHHQFSAEAKGHQSPVVQSQHWLGRIATTKQETILFPLHSETAPPSPLEQIHILAESRHTLAND